MVAKLIPKDLNKLSHYQVKTLIKCVPSNYVVDNTLLLANYNEKDVFVIIVLLLSKVILSEEGNCFETSFSKFI